MARDGWSQSGAMGKCAESGVIRRDFLGLVAQAGVTGLCVVEAGCARTMETAVLFRVEGFTCVTCAVGLETLLGRERGVRRVTATYPEGMARVVYDADVTGEAALAEAIHAMGFRASVVAG